MAVPTPILRSNPAPEVDGALAEPWVGGGRQGGVRQAGGGQALERHRRRRHAEPMQSIGPEALVADVRDDDRGHAGGTRGGGRAGAAVMDDEAGAGEERAMVDAARHEQAGCCVRER